MVFKWNLTHDYKDISHIKVEHFHALLYSAPVSALLLFAGLDIYFYATVDFVEISLRFARFLSRLKVVVFF